jgi:hypothetical protein
MARRTGRVLTLAVALSLLLASAATAATRYAAPGGTGADPCANPAKPCSVFTAADQYAPHTTIEAGDVVELAPGTYYAEVEGEFGYIPSVALPAGVTVRGEPGKARPVIVLRDNEAYGAFYVPTGAEVADVEIRNRARHGPAIEVSGGTLDRVIARSTGSGEPTCDFLSGTIRSSACLSSGRGSAIGANVAAKGTYVGVIRNSTLIATGPGSVGMDFICLAFKRGMTVSIDAAGVLVKGEEKDVIASGLPLNKGRGAKVRIVLRASSYATVETKATDHGRATITAPGTNGNITAPPLLAADNLHQLPGSPTVDKGATDGASDTLDIDKQPRTIGGLPDIGADELGDPAPQVNPIPATELGRQPGKQTPERIAEFTFGSNEPASRYECKLDRKPFRACTSPFRKKVRVGKHMFQVRAVDPQGQVDRTPAVFRWRVFP